jgi:hypothetical protein
VRKAQTYEVKLVQQRRAASETNSAAAAAPRFDTENKVTLPVERGFYTAPQEGWAYEES